MAIKRDITESDHFFKNEKKRIPFTIYQSDGVTPQNISGWTLGCYVSKSADPLIDPVIEKVSTDAAQIEIIAAASGTGQVHIEKADTTALDAPYNYHWCIARIDVSNPTVLTFGRFYLNSTTGPK